MLEKIKVFLKKYGIFVSIAAFILILFTMILILLLREEEQPYQNGTDIVDTDPRDDSEAIIIRQPLGYHKNYEINFSIGASNQLSLKGGEYYGFNIKNVSHLNWVENFVEKIGKSNFSYTKEDSTADNISHFWRNNNDSIFYDENRDFLILRFDQAIYIPGVTFNPRNRDSLLDSLDNMAANYFSTIFEYEIHDVTILGNNYRIEYSRILENTPIYLDNPKEYLLLTQDGRLKEATFLLAEFEKYSNTKFTLISADDLVKNISLKEYPKTIEFKNLDPEVEARYYSHGYTPFSNPFTQEGVFEISEVQLVYYYVGFSQDMVVPTFFFEGSGLLDVEGNLERADFTVLASALDSKYVYIHPASHFEILESIE